MLLPMSVQDAPERRAGATRLVDEVTDQMVRNVTEVIRRDDCLGTLTDTSKLFEWGVFGDVLAVPFAVPLLGRPTK